MNGNGPPARVITLGVVLRVERNKSNDVLAAIRQLDGVLSVPYAMESALRLLLTEAPFGDGR